MVKNYFDLNKFNRLSIILSFILSFIVYIFIYLTGGVPSSFANLMYIPIAITSSINPRIHSGIHAIFCGILLGPLMQINNEFGMGESTLSWFTRMVIYVIISFIIGSFASYNKKSREYITNMLTHDSVTDLKNIEAIRREEIACPGKKTVIALSIAEYEEILSFFGYDFTNEAVVKFSQRLKDVLSKYSEAELFRYDGMEFIIVLSHIDGLDNKDEIIESLSSINKSTIKIDNLPIYIEVVMGLTSIEADTAVLEGVRQAMVSLRYALGKGSKLEVFNDKIEKYFKNLVSIASEFKAALNNGNIRVAYQNIYCTKTGKIHGSELLSRWISNGQVVYNPGDFIPVIEKTELINELTKSIIDSAIDRLNKERDTNLKISINFSPRDFKDEIIDYLLDKIKKNNISPKRLLVEITEDIFVNREEVVGYLYKIRNHGVSVAIDDFGTGYSSYQYLIDLPIDIIKIDGFIIKRIEYSHRSKSLVKSIVDFSKSNNIKTVAEGVDNMEVLNACKELEIDYIQGYYLHKPTIID